MNLHITFTIDERPAFVAFAAKDDVTRLMSGTHLRYLKALTEHGRRLMRRGALISTRPSLPDEIAAFEQLGAATVAAGRIDEDELRDGWPIYLIECTDPELPHKDINTGVPRPMAAA